MEEVTSRGLGERVAEEARGWSVNPSGVLGSGDVWEDREAWMGRSRRHRTSFPRRHRACNMFVESYKAAWILTEDHSFEDRMIDDLSVSWGLPGSVGAEWNRTGAQPSIVHLQGWVALRTGGYGNQGPWLGQNQGRVQDVGEEKKKTAQQG